MLYSCDFESAAENANWVINKTSAARPITGYKNIWNIGTAGCSAAGSLGLYICPQTDTTKYEAIASTTTDYVVAYRENINLGAAGTYKLSFDWKAMGKATDILYVYWFPSSFSGQTNSNYGTAGLPNAWTQYKLLELRGKPVWQSYYGTFNVTEASGKLMFVWYQSAGSVTNPPAAVDNIEIMENTTCAAPTNLKYNSSGLLTWNGNASSYDVRYCNTNANTWTVVNGLTTNTCPVTGITEGYYMFQVRSNCDNSVHSNWVTVSQFAYVKGARCLDFMDLDSTAQCYTGSAQSSNYNAKITPGKVDHGYESDQSQHTIHYLPGETDERTNGGLLTIPQGEVASVRLGNWDDGYGAEAIEYKLKVLPGASDIIKLKYAVVLEYASHHVPGGPEIGTHTGDEQSHFYLSIMDAQGHLLDEGCSSFNFSPSPAALSDPTWHQTQYNNLDVMWKEWTEVSISLAKYIGKTITIHLATYDCTASAHFGYAYFAINCENGQLEGVSCGDFSTDHFAAPEGFKYRWYRANDPSHTVLDTARVFNISTSDTTVYLVDVINKVNNCSYTLTANPNPRFPETNVTYEAYQEDCQNYVLFYNSSEVVNINRMDSTKTISDETLDDVAWDFGDGTPIVHSVDSILVHQFPKAGGLFNVRVTSSMSGGVCTNVQTYPITIPEAGDWLMEKTDTVCYGQSYSFYGKTFTSSVDTTLFLGQRTSKCDSLAHLKLTVLPELKSTRQDTTICDGDVLSFGKNTISKTGTYTAKFPGAHGCDSTVTWTVNVKDPIQPNVNVTPIVEDGDLGAFDITGTGFTYYTVNGVRHEASDRFITGLTPDTYLLIFYNDIDCEKAFTYELGQGCIANFVYQRWNDVLSVKNPEYSGGRSYKKYQWMKNGVDVPGATKSYYAAAQYPETEPTGHLDFNAVYEVALAADSSLTSEWQISCPYRPIDMFSALEDVEGSVLLEPTYLHTGEEIWLLTANKARVVCYTPSGLEVFSTEVSAGRSTLQAPSVAGVYVVAVFTGSGKKSYKICVVE